MNDTQQKTTTTVMGLTAVNPDKQGWKDETVEGGPMIDRNPAVATHAYGTGPLGYDQHLIHANSGSPVLGYWFDKDGELYLTALIAGRFNLEEGAHLPEVAGGFAKVDPETGAKDLPKSGALRELVEETGFDLKDVIFTGGSPFIGDRAFFWKLVGEGNNVYMFALEQEHVNHINLSPNLELKHWNEFQSQSVDGITLGSMMRVLGALASNGILKVVKA